jgi:hypothetical protein
MLNSILYFAFTFSFFVSGTVCDFEKEKLKITGLINSVDIELGTGMEENKKEPALILHGKDFSYCSSCYLQTALYLSTSNDYFENLTPADFIDETEVRCVFDYGFLNSLFFIIVNYNIIEKAEELYVLV